MIYDGFRSRRVMSHARFGFDRENGRGVFGYFFPRLVIQFYSLNLRRKTRVKRISNDRFLIFFFRLVNRFNDNGRLVPEYENSHPRLGVLLKGDGPLSFGQIDDFMERVGGRC